MTLPTEEQVIKTILTAVEGNFPKNCTCCERRFYSYRMFLQEATPLGSPVSYDAETENWAPEEPLGFLAYWKCNSCANTLTTHINSLGKETISNLLAWVKEEMKRSGVSSREVLNGIRVKMRKLVLSE